MAEQIEVTEDLHTATGAYIVKGGGLFAHTLSALAAMLGVAEERLHFTPNPALQKRTLRRATQKADVNEDFWPTFGA